MGDRAACRGVAGSNQGVTPGAPVTIVGSQGGVLDTGVVDQVFPNISKVRPFKRPCGLPSTGLKVLIQLR